MMGTYGPLRLIGGTWLALLLASCAGSFITGQELIVDGGYAAMTI